MPWLNRKNTPHPRSKGTAPPPRPRQARPAPPGSPAQPGVELAPLDGSARLSSLTAAQRRLLIGEARDGQLELRVVLDLRSSTASSVDGMTGSPVSVGLAHRPVLGPPEPLGHRAAREESLPPDLAAALRAEPRLDAEGQ